MQIPYNKMWREEGRCGVGEGGEVVSAQYDWRWSSGFSEISAFVWPPDYPDWAAGTGDTRIASIPRESSGRREEWRRSKNMGGAPPSHKRR